MKAKINLRAFWDKNNPGKGEPPKTDNIKTEVVLSQKMNLFEFLNSLSGSDKVELGFYENKPADAIPLPLDLDVPQVTIITPYLVFGIAGIPVKFCVALR